MTVRQKSEAGPTIEGCKATGKEFTLLGEVYTAVEPACLLGSVLCGLDFVSLRCTGTGAGMQDSMQAKRMATGKLAS